jgi:Ser-tRNA(Ala) deacylase AlaX
MSVKKVFWTEPYRTELDAAVTSACKWGVTLDRTILYAFSGGQQSDDGTIGGYPVLKAEKDGMEIRYALPEGHGLLAGDPVHLVLDWEKRFKLMRLHFAAELVLEWVYRHYGHPQKMGANISADKARVDFRWNGNISAVFPDLVPAIRQLITEDHAIVSAFSDEAAELRYWEIEGFAKVPCGGTHPRRTGEIGPVSLKRSNPGGGRERIEIMLADSFITY